MNGLDASDPACARWIRRFPTTGRERGYREQGSPEQGSREPGSWEQTLEPASTRLLCFPHAGGSAGFYFPFARALAPQVEVLAVQYPGRQDRSREAGIDDVRTLARSVVTALRPLLDHRPLALFGHSMGATVAYEVALLLEQQEGVRPALLFASGRRAPSRHRPEWAHLKDDEGLADELCRLGGTHAELLRDPGVCRAVLPAVRVDYRAIETYRHHPGPELRCPIAVLTGADDPLVTADEAADWRHHSTGAHTLNTFAGGHFFLSDLPGEVLSLVAERMAACRTSEELSRP